MNNLFTELENQNKQIPLAEILRPKTLEEFMGQSNIVADKKVPKINILLGVKILFLLYLNLLKTNASIKAARKIATEIPHHTYQYIVSPPFYSFTIL